jgi:hypothetical protein
MFLFNLVQFSLLKNHVSKEGENHENKKANCNSCITASDKSVVLLENFHLMLAEGLTYDEASIRVTCFVLLRKLPSRSTRTPVSSYCVVADAA